MTTLFGFITIKTEQMFDEWKGEVMRDEYILRIKELIGECKDDDLILIVLRLLEKAKQH